jgi:hypothetical protein
MDFISKSDFSTVKQQQQPGEFDFDSFNTGQQAKVEQPQFDIFGGTGVTQPA